MSQSRLNFRFIERPGHMNIPRPWRHFKSPHRGLYLPLQRVLALLGLLVLAPLLLILVFIIRIESKGPAIYKQVRVGRHGERFSFYKLRSMRVKEDPLYFEPLAEESCREGICKKYINDPRITRLGLYLRRFSIDEIPQLWNVVLGHMALVGPRPALLDEVEHYKLHNMARLKVLPGITGIWQISGRADIPFEQQIQLDQQYIAQQSPFTDLHILWKTVPAVLSTKGAY